MDIKINEADWNGLSEEERANIKNLINNIFKETHQILPDGTATSVGTEQLGSFCTMGCDLVQSAAEIACKAIPNPIAQQVCLVAAQKAGDFCRRKC